MSVKDYPVTLKYGATSYPYTPSKPHRGRDYGCPSGTSLVVGGQTIGLSGATGYVFGAHTHVQEWAGGYANTREPNNAFKGGTVVNIDPVGTYPNNKNDGTQGDGTFGKFITIQSADGWNDTYCHLSQINVQIGQKVGQVSTPIDVLRIIASEIEGFPMQETHDGVYDKMLNDAWGWQPAENYVRHGWQVNPKHRGYLVNDINTLTKSNAALTTQNQALTTANGALTTQLKTANDQITDLTKQNEDLTKKNAELQKKLDEIAGGDAIIITRDSWNGLFDLIKEYFNKKNKK